jgi:ferrous iron transport protein A
MRTGKGNTMSIALVGGTERFEKHHMPLGLLADGEMAMVVRISEKKGGERERGRKEGCHACGGNQPMGRSCRPVTSAAEAGSPSACIHGNRIEDMGIRVGKNVEMLKNPGRGPLLLKVDEARIAIGRTMAMRILVRRKN